MAEQRQQGKNVPIGTQSAQGQGQPREQGQPQGGRAMQPSRQQGLGGYGGGRYGQALSPFSFVRRMMDDMDRLFGDLGGGSSLPSLFDEDMFGGELAQAQAWSPQVEVFEKNGNFIIRADLPGVDQKDVKVDIEDEMLTIQGERRAEHEEKREGYFHSERSYGSFMRRIPLPRGADRSSCDAVFENGVLEIKMKMPEKAARNVQIRGGAAGKAQQQPSSQPSTREQAPVSHNGPPAAR